MRETARFLSASGNAEIHAAAHLITMREQVERTTAPQRIGGTILVAFATLALGLAAVGCAIDDGYAAAVFAALLMNANRSAFT